MDKTWEPWPAPWLGWEVWKQLHTCGLGSAYKVARNRLGLRKFFLTKAAAQRYADALNQEPTQ